VRVLAVDSTGNRHLDRRRVDLHAVDGRARRVDRRRLRGLRNVDRRVPVAEGHVDRGHRADEALRAGQRDLRGRERGDARLEAAGRRIGEADLDRDLSRDQPLEADRDRQGIDLHDHDLRRIARHDMDRGVLGPVACRVEILGVDRRAKILLCDLVERRLRSPQADPHVAELTLEYVARRNVGPLHRYPAGEPLDLVARCGLDRGDPEEEGDRQRTDLQRKVVDERAPQVEMPAAPQPGSGGGTGH